MINNRPPSRNKFLSLRVKTLVTSALFFFSVFFVLGVTLISASRVQVDAQLKEDLLQTLEGAAAGVDVEMLLELAAEGEANQAGFSDDPRYLELIGWLDTIHQTEPDAWPYLYIPGEKPNEVLLVVDLYAIYDQGKSAKFMEAYESNSGFILIGLERQTFRHVESSLGRSVRAWAERAPWTWMQEDMDGLADWLVESGIAPVREFGIYGDKFGRWASGYMPLLDQEGNKVAGIGVDFSADKIEAQYRQAQVDVFHALFISSILPMVFLYFLLNSFVWPVRDLTEIARQIPVGDDPPIASFAGFRHVVWRDEIDCLAEMLQDMIKKIRRREQRYLAVISTQDEVIIRFSPEGKISFVNQAYYDLIGAENFSDMSNATGAGIHPEDRERYFEFLSVDLQSISPDYPQEQIEVRVYDIDHNLRTYLWTVTGLFDEDNILTEYQAVGQDITTLKETQRDLERASSRLQELSHELINANERERIALAREIHDDLLNYLSELMMELDGDVPADSVRDAYQMIAHRARQTVFALRPPMLSYGLYPGLEDYVTNLTERAGDQIRIDFDVKDEGPQNPREEDIHFFRIVQQACENALEHANPAHIVISGYLGEDKVSLRVEDDGEGFEWESGDFLDTAISQKHFGMAGMLERGEIISAKVEVSSSPKAGTRISVNWEPTPK